SGKTTTLNRILKNYKQKIYHPEHNFTQLVYLKIDCPYNGSLKSLYLNFFSAVDRALGTNYEQQYTQKRHNEQKLLQLMGHIAHLHAIGLLVIDE
ncbi:ATP-binding protein, partial [Acinetobacter baumannii]